MAETGVGQDPVQVFGAIRFHNNRIVSGRSLPRVPLSPPSSRRRS